MVAILAALGGVVAALVAAFALANQPETQEDARPTRPTLNSADALAAIDGAPPPGSMSAAGAEFDKTKSPPSAAMAYAIAVQQGDCAAVIGATPWMQERLQLVKRRDPDAVDAAYNELCETVTERRIEANRLSADGIPDQYVFAPGAEIEEAGRDDGRDDLESPVQERIWLEVTYPTGRLAPVDETGRPIRSMQVGVNVGENGTILKAGILGNLEIDRQSIEYAP